MATFTVDETVGSYRVKSDLTQLIPVTREWATNPVVTDVQFPLTYRYPYDNKAFFVDTGTMRAHMDFHTDSGAVVIYLVT